jgi:hypothetical protein
MDNFEAITQAVERLCGACRYVDEAYKSVCASDVRQAITDLERLAERNPSEETSACLSSFSALISSMELLHHTAYAAVVMAAMELLVAVISQNLSRAGAPAEGLDQIKAALQAAEEKIRESHEE